MAMTTKEEFFKEAEGLSEEAKLDVFFNAAEDILAEVRVAYMHKDYAYVSNGVQILQTLLEGLFINSTANMTSDFMKDPESTIKSVFKASKQASKDANDIIKDLIQTAKDNAN
jgi:hypothetical protein